MVFDVSYINHLRQICKHFNETRRRYVLRITSSNTYLVNINMTKATPRIHLIILYNLFPYLYFTHSPSIFSLPKPSLNKQSTSRYRSTDVASDRIQIQNLFILHSCSLARLFFCQTNVLNTTIDVYQHCLCIC